MTASHSSTGSWEQLSSPFGGSAAEGSSTGMAGVSTSTAMDTYFECITTCSLEDGECVTRCVEELREQP